MSSIIKVDTVQDIDGNNIINENANTITIGASGDTITIPSGATFDSSAATNTLPTTVVTTTGTQTLTNKSIATTQLTGTVATSNLGTGTASSSTFLRGDQTFQTVSSYTDSDALSLFNASGSTPVYACRAWCSFNGTGTPAIYGSGNVSSITDVATGKWQLNFATAMPDINYACSANSAEDTDPGGYGNYGAGTQFSFFRYAPAATVNNVNCAAYENSGAFADLATIQVSIFR
jgi:hypothetical protein